MNGIGDPDNPKEKKKKVIRYPEDGMSAQPKRQRLDRDREAALTIAAPKALWRPGGPKGFVVWKNFDRSIRL
jgi:hypothetical protein